MLPDSLQNQLPLNTSQYLHQSLHFLIYSTKANLAIFLLCFFLLKSHKYSWHTKNFFSFFFYL